jgi:tRNA modification GTPase
MPSKNWLERLPSASILSHPDGRLVDPALGRLTGAVYTDDLLDRIFSRFCIGK